MSAYKVFQAAPMDYHLEPGRYEETTFVLLTARYELTMECDWCAKLQGELNASGSVVNDEMDVEKMRSALCDFYSDGRTDDLGESTQASNGSQTINVQWKDLIDGILRATAWEGVSGSTRIVQQTKVNSELAYAPDVTVDGLGFDNVSSTSAVVYDPLHPDGSTLGSRKICGIAEKLDASQSQYDHESIGQLINNTNMREILVKMRNHGCFIKDSDDSVNSFVLNPVVVENTSGADGTTVTKRLLDLNDKLIFPVNLKSIVGHTATAGDEQLQDGHAYEINIIFNQNVATDAEPADGSGNMHDDLNFSESNTAA